MPRFALSLLLLVFCPGPLTAAWAWQGTTGAVWHGNVTNSDRASDRLAALQWQSELTGDFHRSLPGGNTVSAGLSLGLDLWPRYQGLDSLTIGPTVGFQHKFGLGAQAWVLNATATGGWGSVREANRSGLASQLQFEIRKRWGDSWQFALGTERARYEARHVAFDRSGRENYLRGEYQLNAVWHATVELRQRAGLVISYTTPPRPDLVQAGKILTLVDTFERPTPLLAYYFPADTRSASIELVRLLDPATSAYLRIEYGETRHNALRYLNPRSTLGVIHRF